MKFRFSTQKVAAGIILEYADLVARKNLKPLIQQAYGPQGLGILFVNGIPGFAQQRKATLPVFQELAKLPKEILKKYQRPQIYHALGWSCGVEQFQGKYDTSKGSYYINCASDQPYPIKPEEEKYFSEEEKKMYSANRWVQELPQLQKNVKSLAKLMIETGALLAWQIDDYARSKVSTYPENHLRNMIKMGRSHIGRILHYFPFEAKGDTEDDWCGWHNDHGALTALTSALYTDHNGDEIAYKLKTGGLFAKNRFADTARISIPSEMLAFQLGESMQILSGGQLQATPHCVVRSEELAGKNVGRNTFAIFMEPDPLQVMRVPVGVSPEKVTEKAAYKVPQIKQRWENEIYFKEFHKNTIKHYS